MTARSTAKHGAKVFMTARDDHDAQVNGVYGNDGDEVARSGVLMKWTTPFIQARARTRYVTSPCTASVICDAMLAASATASLEN